MADVVLTERSRVVVSWGVFLAFVGVLVAGDTVRASVTDHERRIILLEGQASQAATKKDIERIEARIMRIEELLITQQSASAGGRR